MELTNVVILAFLVTGVFGLEKSTKIEKRLLSRQKRYLTFPEGSNFVMTASVIKSVMVKTPRGINMLGEMDVPFRLPSDTRIFRRRRPPHHRQRREIFNQLASAMDGFGLNGTGCIKRMLCEAEGYLSTMEDSMLKDMLAVILKPNFEDDKFNVSCNNNTNNTQIECDVSLLDLLSNVTPLHIFDTI